MRRELVALGAVIGVLIGVVAFLFLTFSFIPAQASEQGKVIERTMQLLLAIAGGIFVLIFGILIYSVVRFRRPAGDTTDGPPIQSNPWLVGAFVFIPLVLVLWSATYSTFKMGEIEHAHALPLRSQPNHLEVRVTAFRWAWSFEYPEYGIKTEELVLPVGRPVQFKMTSRDVIHSFWVPEWGVKMDTVPGMETSLHVTPTEVGAYKVMCAELCGVGHTVMVAPAKVVTEEEFQKWVEEQRQ